MHYFYVIFVSLILLSTRAKEKLNFRIEHVKDLFLTVRCISRARDCIALYRFSAVGLSISLASIPYLHSPPSIRIKISKLFFELPAGDISLEKTRRIDFVLNFSFHFEYNIYLKRRITFPQCCSVIKFAAALSSALLIGQ